MLPEWQRVKDALDQSGVLPAGYTTRMVMYSDHSADKWTALISGPKGSTNWIEIKKIPSDALRLLG